jgi:DNA (cytosine-5)-methyltransferase 1
LTSADIAWRADLVWLSPPCVGHSEAGKRAGFDEEESRAFWPAWALVEGLVAEGRAPLIAAFENVTGIKPENLRAVQAAFAHAGYAHATRIIDARHFVPQKAARLMGLPDSYQLPRNDVEAYDLLGDGALHRAKVHEMGGTGHWVARTYFRRRRLDGNGGKIQRAKVGLLAESNARS